MFIQVKWREKTAANSTSISIAARHRTRHSICFPSDGIGQVDDDDDADQVLWEDELDSAISCCDVAPLSEIEKEEMKLADDDDDNNGRNK